MTKTISILILLMTAGSAFADLIPSPNDHTYTQVNCVYAGVQPVVVRANSCGKQGICFAEVLCNGTNTTQVSCNAVGVGLDQCPAAIDCLNDPGVFFVMSTPSSVQYDNQTPQNDGAPVAK